MPVRIRFARFGRRNHPYWRIRVGDSRRTPTKKFIEEIGTFNPSVNKFGNKELRLNVLRAKYWLSVGAQPSTAVARLFAKFQLMPKKPIGALGTNPKNLSLKEWDILKFGPQPKGWDIDNPPLPKTEEDGQAEQENVAA